MICFCFLCSCHHKKALIENIHLVYTSGLTEVLHLKIPLPSDCKRRKSRTKRFLYKTDMFDLLRFQQLFPERCSITKCRLLTKMLLNIIIVLILIHQVKNNCKNIVVVIVFDFVFWLVVNNNAMSSNLLSSSTKRFCS